MTCSLKKEPHAPAEFKDYLMPPFPFTTGLCTYNTHVLSYFIFVQICNDHTKVVKINRYFATTRLVKVNLHCGITKSFKVNHYFALTGVVKVNLYCAMVTSMVTLQHSSSTRQILPTFSSPPPDLPPTAMEKVRWSSMNFGCSSFSCTINL